ncbi:MULTISPECIES: hypothetical protein [Flavobacterium]|uniref:Uncharacterized protein n=1 Tax=Flavobacterium hankyongi TaxID=1176532 RepID=A0ABP9A030_9FLAO|nr:hypothetical protein [Flavobacterium sp. N1846]
MQAALNAVMGGRDYSNGALRWDGFDFAKNGFDHIKARTARLNINTNHLNTFLGHSAYSKYNPTNSLSAGVHLATSGNYKGMSLYSSSATYGGTIFWAPNPTNFAIGTSTVNGRNSGFSPCIQYDIVKPNINFNGKY